MPRVGEVLGRLRLTHLAGEGSTSWVFAAEHLDTRLKAAVKVSKPTACLRRFEREGVALARVRGEHVVELWDQGGDERFAWLAHELLAGRSLRQLYEWEGVGTVARALAIAIQIAEALAAVHTAGVIHGDVSADNVLLVHRRGSRDYVKLIDFGSAELDTTAPRRVVARRKSDLGGRPEYMAPEQLAGRGFDRRADVYSFGVVLYEMVTGTRPFSGDFDRLVVDQLTKRPARPRQHPGAAFEIPPELERLILRCLEKDPVKRPTSMRSLRDELAIIAVACAQEQSRRARRWALATAMAAVAVLGGLLVALRHSGLWDQALQALGLR